ncbi:hypothetical protein FRB99_007328 [Tulasnella sp. 403]|nr:hypothetical protein FRB99_007328 [Tulasnella sp. 403]
MTAPGTPTRLAAAPSFPTQGVKLILNTAPSVNYYTETSRRPGYYYSVVSSRLTLLGLAAKYSLSSSFLKLQHPIDVQQLTPTSVDAFRTCIIAWRFSQPLLAAYAFRFTHHDDVSTYYKLVDGIPGSIRYYRPFIEMDSQREQAIELLQAKLPSDILCSSYREKDTARLRYKALVKDVLERTNPCVIAFIDPEQWLHAGIAKDCVTGDCETSIKSYPFTMAQMWAIDEVFVKEIPDVILGQEVAAMEGVESQHCWWLRHLRSVEATQPIDQPLKETSAPEAMEVEPTEAPHPTFNGIPPTDLPLNAYLHLLSKIEAEFSQLKKLAVTSKPLAFLHPPQPRRAGGAQDPGLNAFLRERDLTLDPKSAQNRLFLHVQTTITELQARLDDLPVPPDSKTQVMAAEMRRHMEERLSSLVNFQILQWMEQALTTGVAIPPGTPIIDTAQFFAGPRTLNVVPLACILLISFLHLVFHFSHYQATFIMQSLQIILLLAAQQMARHQYTPAMANAILGPLPAASLEAIIDKLQITDSAVDFACCPECYKLYKLPMDGATPELTCSNLVKSRRCGAKLFSAGRKNGKIVAIPRRRFHYQSIKSWLAKLLCRPRIEDMIEQTTNGIATPPTATDIWHGTFVNTFNRMGESFWHGSPEMNEGRLLFALAIDWFAAHNSGPARKTWSVGAMFLVCLNLPKNIRFKPENVCLLGIIPGPSKPTPTQLHYFLDIVTTELLEFWTTGVWYTKTWKYPLGRLIRAALGPVICDLDASRGVAGFTPHTHTLFCSYCLLSIRSIKQFMADLWPRRSEAAHRANAKRWYRQNGTDEERAASSAITGVTSSPLLRLKYWNPLVCTILDPMHNLFLGVIQRHFRHVWGISAVVEGGDGQQTYLNDPPTAEEMARGRHVLRTGTKEAFSKLYVRILRGLCFEAGLFNVMNSVKDEIIEALLSWRIEKGIYSEATENVAAADDALLVAYERNNWKSIKKSVLQRLYKRYTGRDPACTLSHDNMAAALLDVIPPLEVTNQAELDAQVLQKIVKSDRHVLGRVILGHYRWDRDRTVMPHWITAAPKQVGAKAQGHLSADQWRVLATVHFVITLVRLWGMGQADSSPWRLMMLDNFIHLVLAVKYATSRSTSKAYHSVLPPPLDDLVALMKSGLSSYKGNLMVDNSSADVLWRVERRCAKAPRKTWRRGGRTSHHSDCNKTCTTAPPDLLRHVRETFPMAMLHDCASVTKDNTKYEPFRPSSRQAHWDDGRNSYIELYLPQEPGKLVRGKILHIYQIQVDPSTTGNLQDVADIGSTFALIEPCKELPDTDRRHDPFLRWPELEAALYTTQFNPPIVVPFEAIRAHVVRCKWSSRSMDTAEVMLLMSLYRVRLQI